MTVGVATGGKAINLNQLQGELDMGSVGFGMAEDYVYTYDAAGTPADFDAAGQTEVAQGIANHVAMRDKTDEEYSAEFQAAGTTAGRKQEIRDITAGLLPREQVPYTQAEWDTRMGAPVG